MHVRKSFESAASTYLENSATSNYVMNKVSLHAREQVLKFQSNSTVMSLIQRTTKT